MDNRKSICLLTLAFSGCMSAPTSDQASDRYAVLDAASGVTYNVPLRFSLAQAALPRAFAPVIVSDAALAEVRQLSNLSERQSSATPLATTSAASAQQVTERSPVVQAATEAPSPSRERAQVGAPIGSTTHAVSLRLDKEFASAKRLVIFALGRSTLGPKGKLAVAELVPWAKQAERVHVRGGVDASGDTRRNRELAIGRASAVSAAFAAAGVAREKIFRSFCTTCYVASNEEDQGRRLNRRVDVELVMQKELIAQLPTPVHALELPGQTPSFRATAFSPAGW